MDRAENGWLANADCASLTRAGDPRNTAPAAAMAALRAPDRTGGGAVSVTGVRASAPAPRRSAASHASSLQRRVGVVCNDGVACDECDAGDAFDTRAPTAMDARAASPARASRSSDSIVRP